MSNQLLGCEGQDSGMNTHVYELIASNKTSLNVSELKKILAYIRSDEIRPELLRLQEKTLSSLDGLVKPAEQLAKASLVGERNLAARKEQAKRAAQPLTKQHEDLLPQDNFSSAPPAAPMTREQVKRPPPVNRLHGADNVDELVAQAKEAVKNRVKLSVLLIDEDNISLNLSSRLFPTKHYDLYMAATGHAAVSFIQNKKIDLVFMDVTLQDCDCINLAEQINRREGNKPKFVILTSNKNKESIRRAATAGVKMYLLKPLVKVALHKVIEKCGLDSH